MDNRGDNENLEKKGYQELGFFEGQAPISFDPFPLNVDNEPTNPRRSWNQDLQDLRNQFPFVQIDPPFTSTTKFRLDASSVSSTVVPVPANAQMYRITYHSNNAQISLGLSHSGDTDNSGSFTGYYESSVIYNPQPIWRFCRFTNSIALFKCGPGGTGILNGTIEWFCQL